MFDNGIRFIGSQEGDREYQVNLAERHGQLEAVGTLRDDTVNWVRA